MDLAAVSARELVTLIASRQASVREVMSAHLERIRRLNPTLNALVAKLDDERCLALADAADQAVRGGGQRGQLFGLPVAFKDTEPAVGFPQTQGSPIFRNCMPVEDSIVVERIRRAGAIPIAKTNVPEFAMGSHTYNRVYGSTRNPFDQTKSAGGSTGGGAVAVTTGMLPLADGSDLGGSLRNPASFNNVVGYRPSVGLVPLGPGALPYGFGVKGPVARSVNDAALLLNVMAGADDRDPATYPTDDGAFLHLPERDPVGVRVAWCPDLGGLPLDPRVRTALDATRRVLEGLGCRVEEACPDLHDADDVFLTIRRWRSGHTLGALVQQHRAEIKPEAIEEAEAGARISGAAIAEAMARHVQLMARVAAFQRDYEFIACAVSQLPPFDIELTWPREIDGTPMASYVDWMKSAYLISATWCPAVSMPAGFTCDGLPVGVQFVGRHRADVALLAFAAAFERAHPVGRVRPAIATAA